MTRIKYFYSTLLCIGFLGFCLLSLTACTPTWVNQILNITNVVWRSENPEIEILILYENPYSGFGYIINGNDKKDIYLSWTNSRFIICLADKYSATPFSPITNEFVYIKGHYNLINNIKVELKVNSDEIFQGTFNNSVFILTYEKIDSEMIDAKYRTNIRWFSTSKQLTFSLGPEERNRGKGELKCNGISHNIFFYWEENSKFSVYELQNDFQSQSPILSGTYVSENLKATLTIEEDSIFNHEFDTIQLVAKGLNDP